MYLTLEVSSWVSNFDNRYFRVAYENSGYFPVEKHFFMSLKLSVTTFQCEMVYILQFKY